MGKESVRRATMWCAALLILVKPSPTAPAAAPPLGPDGKTIARLVSGLGHSDGAVRDAAHARLLKLGPVALLHCRTSALQERNNVAWRQSFMRLVVAIQEKHGVQSIREKGLEFLPTADLVWRLPAPGGERPIKLGVKVTNLGDQPLKFFLLSTVMPGVSDAQGKSMSGGCWQNGLRPKNYLPTLQKGQNLLVSDFNAKLYRSDDGKTCVLSGFTDSGLYFRFKDLKPGRYYLWFACLNNGEWSGKQDGGVPIWTGSIGTPFVVVEIK